MDLAVRILKRLTRYDSAHATLTEICIHLDAPKSSCLRVLRTLESHGLVRHDPRTRQYSLGTWALVLGARAQESIEFIPTLQGLLTEASEGTGLTSVFVQRIDSGRMMYIAKQEARARLGISVSVGNRFPITEVSYGQWLLAYMPPQERDEILVGGLRSVTPNTITDRNQYRARLDRIRAEGVLVSRGEYVPGICATSCPIFDTRDSLLGVLTVLDTMPSMTRVQEHEITGLIRDIGKRSRDVFRGSPPDFERSSQEAANE